MSYTDQNAQFLAYDVLTVLSGLAGALLVGAAFTRMLWPLGLTIGVWLLASLIIGRLYPEAIQRLTVEPNQYAQEQGFIANNIAMTRLAYGLDHWEDDRQFHGEEVLDQAAIEAEAATFRNARLWDYRPLGDTLDQLQRIRRYYDFHDVDTDRYVIDDVQRQVMLSARELDLAQNPAAVGFVNQRIVYTHGIGAALVPVNEVTNEGQPRLFIRNLPPVSSDGAPEISEPRIYFGEKPSGYVITGARQAEFDYPTGEGEGGRDPGTGDALARHDRHQPRHDPPQAAVRAAVPRPGPAHQRPDHRREPAPVPSVAGGSARPHRPVPALRQGPVSRHPRGRDADLRPGRVHRVGALPACPGLRPGRFRDRRDAARGPVQLHPQQRQDHDGRL